MRQKRQRARHITIAVIVFLVVLWAGLYLKSEQPKWQASPAATSTGAEPHAELSPAKVTPNDLINLSRWKLTLPVNTAHSGNPDEVTQPELSRFMLDPYFRLNDTEDGIRFRANAGGATTKNSAYPRSELREMAEDGQREASWSSTTGSHTMTIKQAVTHLPIVKPHVVAGQIHDASEDVIMIRLEGSRLFVEASGEDIGVLNAQYALGTIFTVRIEVSNGRIKVFYDDVQKVDYAKRGAGFYFKAGCYTQSSPKQGDAATAYGEVTIYSLVVAHQS